MLSNELHKNHYFGYHIKSLLVIEPTVKSKNLYMSNHL